MRQDHAGLVQLLPAAFPGDHDLHALHTGGQCFGQHLFEQALLLKQVERLASAFAVHHGQRLEKLLTPPLVGDLKLVDQVRRVEDVDQPI